MIESLLGFAVDLALNNHHSSINSLQATYHFMKCWIYQLCAIRWYATQLELTLDTLWCPLRASAIRDVGDCVGLVHLRPAETLWHFC